MILDAARAAVSRLLTPEFRGVFFKSLGLTLLLLVLAWLALRGVLTGFVFPWIDAFLPSMPDWTSWFGVLAGVAASLGIAVGLAFLIAPVTAAIAGLFIDDVAQVVEARDYPQDPPGKAVPLVRGIVLSAKFLGVVLLANLGALLLLLVPGVNIAAFFLVNGYLLGREFFEFAAMRFRSEPDAKAMRRRNGGTVFLAGIVIAAFMAIPLVNLLTPLFAAAMMVHLHKMVSAAERSRARA
ncbi:sulfate transporter family protein [Mesorhizobium sp. Z1-4]|uniref:sulfate transporter family protein n=1 Tax=Mesorhizobium sp. Z1-4 TaxID=2448478 RepID=UPI000FD7FC39|nr:sulfate transporter family protein [Mesorhizobium sp. Z1-4]